MKIFLIVLLFLVSCNAQSKKINAWLIEYEQMLQASILETGETQQKLSQQITQKEKELDHLLVNISVQEKLNFLSRYYDIRTRYNDTVSMP